MENKTNKGGFVVTPAERELFAQPTTNDTDIQTGLTKQTGTAVSISRLSIIIPAYNEEKTIALILDRINEVKLIRNIEKEVIIVNDCSKDNTEAAIQDYIANTKELTINSERLNNW